MKGLLSRLLEKRGIKDPAELTVEERADFERWRGLLDKEEITVADLSAFLSDQLALIERQFGDVTSSPDKARNLALVHSVYRSLRDFANSKKTEREVLIKYLQSLL